MAAQVPPALVLADTLCCLGLGFLLAAVYDTARFLLGDAKPVCFVLDLGAFLLAAVLLCSFAAGCSSSGVVRWYMAGGLLLGLAGYFAVLAPASRALQRLLRWLLVRPLVLAGLLIFRPLGRAAGRAGRCAVGCARRKSKARRKKQQEKQLQTTGKILYNSN